MAICNRKAPARYTYAYVFALLVGAGCSPTEAHRIAAEIGT
jgi:hypothetical protein